MNIYDEKIRKVCVDCKYNVCLTANKTHVGCYTWCKNYQKDKRPCCRCVEFFYNNEDMCPYFEKGETLTDDELIDKENTDYKRYMRIAKRRGFDDAQDNS